jgi:predicted nucleic acid-binding Zn ribbon protein
MTAHSSTWQRQAISFWRTKLRRREPEILKIINSKFCIKGKWLSRKLMM